MDGCAFGVGTRSLSVVAPMFFAKGSNLQGLGSKQSIHVIFISSRQFETP